MRWRLTSFQIVIDEILSKRQDLTEDQVRNLIEQKKKELPGFLSDEGAARLVAEELLIKTRGTELGRIQVKDLVSGLNDVSISGRILLFWPPQKFQRRDGTSGRVMRLIMVDRSGDVRCVLWDRHADVAFRTGNLQGSVIRIGHAYTRQGLSGTVEVHAGERSSIEINPHDSELILPQFDELFTKVHDLQNQSFNVNTVGLVQIEPKRYSFSREDGTGTVLRTILADDSGTIPIVAWNERANALQDLTKGDILQVVNARTKLDSNSHLELHVEARSQAIILKEPPPYLKMPIERIHKITELTPQSSLVNLNVTIVVKGESREVKRATGETLKISTLIVGDETGMLTLSLWDEKAELANRFREGDTVHLRNVSVRDRLGELRLNLGRSGEIEKSATNQLLITSTKISELASAKTLVTIEGTTVDQPVIRQVSTEKGETIDVGSFSIKDETGITQVTLWREQAKLTKELPLGTRLRIIGARVRPGLSGQIELSSVPLTKLSMNSPSDASASA